MARRVLVLQALVISLQIRVSRLDLRNFNGYLPIFYKRKVLMLRHTYLFIAMALY